MSTRPWTPEEDDILRKYYPREGYKLLLLLPHRSRRAIHFRARKLGIKLEPVPFAPGTDS